MRSLLIGIAAMVALSGCEKPLTVPGAQGVCWLLIDDGPNGKPEFRPLAPGVANLETCAVTLEGLHLRSGKAVVGGYQGRYIFLDDQDITAAAGAKNQRYRVFTPEQRAKIRQSIEALATRERGA